MNPAAAETGTPTEPLRPEQLLYVRFNKELEVVRQPVFDLATMAISHHELLLRVRGWRGRLESPQNYLAQARRDGEAAAIDRWVAAEAIEMMRPEDEGPQFEVNLSPDAALDPEFSAFVTELLDRHGASAGALIVEIDDDRLDPAGMAHFSRRLFKIGHHFTLEAFERSGLNTLARLRALPFDLIKIDGEFIRDLPSNPDDQAIVRRIATMVSNVGRKTVAMHIQDEPTLSILKEIGVDLGQGYHLGLPERIPAE